MNENVRRLEYHLLRELDLASRERLYAAARASGLSIGEFVMMAVVAFIETVEAESDHEAKLAARRAHA